jgi:hypothetical protein
MLQADKTTIKWFDYFILMPFAYIISQSIIYGNWWWIIIAYAFFINYAHSRREHVG